MPSEEYLSRAEAELIASQESLRGLTVTATRIEYVRYCSDFDDFCHVQIQFLDANRGVYEIRLLPISERLESEMLNDEHIASVARHGRRLNAVRLHRHLHSTTLIEAIDAVEAMASVANEPPDQEGN